jgi:hypothetical protein
LSKHIRFLYGNADVNRAYGLSRKFQKRYWRVPHIKGVHRARIIRLRSRRRDDYGGCNANCSYISVLIIPARGGAFNRHASAMLRDVLLDENRHDQAREHDP